jgi:beta-glucosidase
VIVVSTLANPFVLGEIEPYADAIFLTFYTQNQIILEFMTSASEPSGLLPFQMPADMKTVEEQFEDVPLDMNCYVDSEGNTYDFAFGLNWSGVINDERVRKYKR